MVFDKVFENYFMQELAKNINKKDAYSLTTYATVYNLIKYKKLKIQFNVALFQSSSSGSRPKVSNIIKAVTPEKKEKENEYTLTHNNSFLYTPEREKDNNAQPSPRSISNSLKAMALRASDSLLDKGWDLLTGWDTSTKITVKGEYNPNSKKIKIICWLYVGIQWEKFILTKPFNSVFKKILSALLHEGLLIYNSRTNGKSLDTNVSDWFKEYFTYTIMKSTNRSTISRYVGNYLGEQWPIYMFTNIEKFLINGQNPLLKEKIVDMKKLKVIKQHPLILDYIKGPFKKLLGEILPSRYDLDIETKEDLKAYTSDFFEFVSFMYFNRYQEFNIEALRNVPKFSSVLPSKGAPWNWDGKCFGFEIVGNYEIFNDCYDDVYDIKNAYNNSKYFKRNFIFCEMFMPTEVQAKLVYYSVMSDNVDDRTLRLIDMATKGLTFL